MKLIKLTLSRCSVFATALLLFSTLTMVSCMQENVAGGGLALQGGDIFGLLTSGTWSARNVSVDGTDYSEEFEDFAISFSDGSYSSTGAAVIFGGGGQWAFGDVETKIILGNGLELTIREITAEVLILEFDWDETIYGKTSAVGGKNVFTLSK